MTGLVPVPSKNWDYFMTRRALIARLRELGFDGPYTGGKHEFMVKGLQSVTKILCKYVHHLQIIGIRSTIVLCLCSAPSKPS
jgi:hypothetical protein